MFLLTKTDSCGRGVKNKEKKRLSIFQLPRFPMKLTLCSVRQKKNRALYHACSLSYLARKEPTLKKRSYTYGAHCKALQGSVYT
jgi:hypothetical protein